MKIRIHDYNEMAVLNLDCLKTLSCQIFFHVHDEVRPRHRWEDNIEMDLQEVGGGRGDWMELAQDRDKWRALVGTVRDFRVP